MSYIVEIKVKNKCGFILEKTPLVNQMEKHRDFPKS